MSRPRLSFDENEYVRSREMRRTPITNEPTLFSQPLDPDPLSRLPVPSQPVETSEDAADQFAGRVGSLRRNVLNVIWARGSEGATADEVALTLNEAFHVIAPRLTELQQAGFLIRLDGKGFTEKRKRATSRGATAFVYLLTRQGEAALK